MGLPGDFLRSTFIHFTTRRATRQTNAACHTTAHTTDTYDNAMRLAICRTALVLANAVLLGYAVGLVALMVHQWAVGSARLDVQPHAVTAPALRHHLLPIVHGQPQLLDSAQAYVIVSLVTALLALVASVAGFVAISKRRGRLLVIALIATTAALLALQIIVTTVAVAQRPAGQVQQREVDGALRGMWTDAWTVDRRAAYQRAHACCGFWNASDVAVVDDRYCFDEGRVALPRGISVSVRVCTRFVVV